MSHGASPQLRLDPSRLDDLAPLYALAADLSGEVFRRVTDEGRASLGETLGRRSLKTQMPRATQSQGKVPALGRNFARSIQGIIQ